ncbi:MAG TPA: hypothetical protein H9755_08910 [Candidatus Dietzia intestinigallinarum]|nr:hypothetical protein [Candidatus Dietzia intestinigallinarum]
MSGPEEQSGDRWEQDFRPDEEMQESPRRSRQPLLAILAILGIILLVLAVAINGGI